MNVLIACEESQEVCKAFRLKGHEAYSCDISPAGGGHTEWHIQDDIRSVLIRTGGTWDLIIAHPPCTRLCNSGSRWLHERNLWEKMREGCEFFNQFKLYYQSHPGVKVCIENPIPHWHARLYIGWYTQIIQPWQFGHGETKSTCLWLFDLPKLIAENIVSGRSNRIHRIGQQKNRSQLRSKTYSGIALAMANQWGNI
jgi:hypothetical protein